MQKKNFQKRFKKMLKKLQKNFRISAKIRETSVFSNLLKIKIKKKFALFYGL